MLSNYLFFIHRKSINLPDLQLCHKLEEELGKLVMYQK